MHEYKIYVITNDINNKVYVGQTIYSLTSRFNKHARVQSYIGHTIRKYGKQYFHIKELAICYNQSDANKLEIAFIREYKSFGYNKQYGYNLTPGGDGGCPYIAWRCNNLNAKCKHCNGDIPEDNRIINFCSRYCKLKYKIIHKNGSCNVDKLKEVQCKKVMSDKIDELIKINPTINRKQAWYIINKEKVLERKNKRYQQNKESIIQKERVRYSNNKNIINAKRKEQRKKDKREQ